MNGCVQPLEVESPMKVELDVFSGRPNPTWRLSSEESDELARRLKDLRPLDQAPAEPGLGYRGFVLSTPDRKIHVYQGALTVTEGGTTQRYVDVNRIEDWLIEQARRHGYGSLVTGGGDPPA